MDVDQYKEGIKKRREERLRLLRRKQRMESFSAGTALGQRPKADIEQDKYAVFPALESEQREDLGMSPWIIKLFITVLLVVGVSVVMNSESPSLADTQDFIQDVMHREFNVAGVLAWYEEAGENLRFLPKFINHSAPERSSYSVPVNGGKVVSEFGQDQQGILVGTRSSLPIEVIKGGWVKAVGAHDSLGQVIVIDHGDQEESWYGQVQDIKVQQNDWVEQGQVIGYTTSSTDGQGIFYFALKRNSIFVDPLDVITFD